MLKLQGSTDDIYNWIERTLNRFCYSLLSKKEKLLVLRYLMQLSGYSRQQMTALSPGIKNRAYSPQALS
jgi:hypothetical protein